MRQQRYLLWALILSVVVHGLVLSWLAPEPDREVQPVTLNLVLQPRPTSEPTTRPSESAAALPTPEPVATAPEPVAQDVPRTPRAAADPPAAIAPEADLAPRPLLNLERPANWTALVEAAKESTTGIQFNPGLRERLETRQQDKLRLALVSARSAAVYGTADDDYMLLTGVGIEIKRDGGCAVLREDDDVEEGTRWWASPCTDTRQNPLTLKPVEYDALGRVVAGQGS